MTFRSEFNVVPETVVLLYRYVILAIDSRHTQLGTRKQWLNSVDSCQSKHHAFFGSLQTFASKLLQDPLSYCRLAADVFVRLYGAVISLGSC